ncbi:hypothetical protein [Phenylobacterium montanum]|uniref:Uncharacterized protein n=1 Tax=Phenylobacterium montanum TaxID=2823693 RepID=A0A975FYC8_9CAUL|nr:hypothetical protein [Caulobacter sp. S6]QUD87113.1 hypothetical protein KCG34_18900 [Caulobacter sp. S6]
MSSTPLTNKQLVAIWWAFFWRATIFGAAGGAATTFIIAFLFGFAGAGQLPMTASAIIGYLAGIPCSVLALRAALSKRYSEFSIDIGGPERQFD